MFLRAIVFTAVWTLWETKAFAPGCDSVVAQRLLVKAACGNGLWGLATDLFSFEFVAVQPGRPCLFPVAAHGLPSTAKVHYALALMSCSWEISLTR